MRSETPSGESRWKFGALCACAAAAAALAAYSTRAVTLSPPVIQEGSITFSFDSAPNQLFTVQSSSSFESGWTNVSSQPGTGSPIPFSAPVGGGQQFFRVMSQPFQSVALSPSEPVLDGGAVSLPDAVAGEAFSAQVSPGNSGTPPYTVQFSGTPPDGVTLTITSNQTANAFAQISGTGTAAGQRRQFSVTVVDSLNSTNTRAYDLRVVAPPPQVTLSQIMLKAGEAVNLQLAATGGAQPLAWSVVSGALPTGLTLSAAGLLSGTPGADAAEHNENGRHTIVIEVADGFTDRVSGAPAPRKATASAEMLARLSYRLNIQGARPNGPSLRQNCLGCHGPGFLPNFDGDAMELIDVKSGTEFGSCGDDGTYVVRGSPSGSLVHEKLTAQPPCGDRMPQGGPYFSGTRLERLSRWIRELAPEDMD